MTKVTKICDRCGRETDWLYKIPTFSIDGLVFTVRNDTNYELCRDCLKNLCDYINRYNRSFRNI